MVGAFLFLEASVYSEEKTTDYKELALEAMELLSNSRVKKEHRGRLREIVREICHQFGETQLELRSLEMAGLNGRDKLKLARLQSMHGRVVNIQVCPDCKGQFDSLLEEMKYL